MQLHQWARTSVMCGLMVMAPALVQAQRVMVSGSGSGVFEAAAVGGPLANGTVGFAECLIDRGAQAIACTSSIFNMVDLTDAHLHIGGPGASGGVILPIPNLPLRVSGDWSQSWTWSPADMRANPAAGINSFEDVMQSCAAGNCYLNWHTTASPGGAMRINLCPARRSANTISGIAVCTVPE
jgi:hypothetical protein